MDDARPGVSTGTTRVVVDFDPHDPSYLEHRHETWQRLRRCPVAYSPAHGGFWVVSGYEQVAQVARDDKTFSSRYPAGAGGASRERDATGAAQGSADAIGASQKSAGETGASQESVGDRGAPQGSAGDQDSADDIAYVGIAGIPRPRGLPAAGMAEADHELHVALRRLLNPFMLPPAVARLTPFMQAVARWCMDQHIAQGHMDLVYDFASPVPAITTLRILGLPVESWSRYAEVFHAAVAYSPSTETHRRALRLIPSMMEELLGEVVERRRSPRDDVMTALAGLRVGGRQLSDPEITAIMWNLVGGGLDTTTSLTSLTFQWLSANPDARRRLVEDRDLLAPATEEFLRYFCVNETLSRTVTRDVELGGQCLRRGDPLLVSWLSANFDEAVFDDPEAIVLERAPNPHLAFGVGPHRCIGLHLARTLFQVMVNEVLERIPDYQVEPGSVQYYQGNPALAGVVRMPATFTPSTPSSASGAPPW